jgi:lysophospholipase L1-like esterase
VNSEPRGGPAMRIRSVMSIALSAVVAASVAAIGLVAVPGISQAATSHAKKAPLEYLSLGDSYSIGYQPSSPSNPAGDQNGSPGYTAYVAKKEKMTLVQFGCGGATTSSIVNSIGCPDYGSSDVIEYPTTTQEAAALAFINDPANAGKVGLITVSIGGNDVTSCAGASGGEVGILGCIETADASITTNVTHLVSDLDSALSANGDTAPVIGLTYPDVILGDWVFPAGATNQSLAGISTTAFDALINPTLQAAYGGATNFVNVTQAPYKSATAGDDTPLTTLKKVEPYGKIPAAVGEICALTYFCTQGNIHANTTGYTFIGKLIVAHLKAA